MPMTPKLKALLVSVMVETRGWNPNACGEHLDKLALIAPNMRPASYARIVANYISAENEQGGAYFTSPALLAETGAHWEKTEYAHRQKHPECPEHHQLYPCPQCELRDLPGKDQIRAIRLNSRRKAAQQRGAP